MGDFLRKMATSSQERAADLNEARFRSSDFDKAVVPLKLGAFDVIAEIKERSPAEGLLHNAEHIDAETARRSRATAYAAGGAAAVSVLTEPSRFDGELRHLEHVVDAVPAVPVMRKDFLVAPVQILEARKAGASGVLLIAAMLSDAKLYAMLQEAWHFDMFVLLESFDEDDLRRSSALLDIAANQDRAARNQLLIGVNTRNLRTLEVDPDRLRKLAPMLPAAKCVAESGLYAASDANRAAGLGYQVALVGTALMRSEDPAALITAMREAGAAD
ncbi:MAG TPA: indole-3-glycerol-phosphate synthase TrpC [Woeseiaceae bacterium]|nr:indole-3-glycerol-phosphate synthase TrpC [Woeseiaceae bacterium]